MAKDNQALAASPRRLRLFATLAIVLGVLLGLSALEMVLGYLRERVETSDRLDQGMMVYDQALGWRLQPGWTGRHQHYDFDVTYTVARSGFRSLPDERGAAWRIAILGDSFTFGLGVESGATFADEVNRRLAPQASAYNFGIPGYSTDQELLLAERLFTGGLDVADVVLVVYLGNDLIDNELAFPVQGPQGKPYFTLSAPGLTLANTPVPRAPKAGAERLRSFATVVMAGEPPPGRLAQLIGGSDIVRRSGIEWPLPRTIFPAAAPRFRPSIELFVTLVERLRETSARYNARLSVVLLPGRSMFAAPASYSAQYQEHIRQEILARTPKIGAPILDIAAGLRSERSDAEAARLYHRYDGHLTAEGNRVVGGLIAEQLRR